MGVPIHVWQPPALESTVGKRVVVPEIGGTAPSSRSTHDSQSPVVLASAIDPASKPSPDVSQSIHEQLLAHAPKDSGRTTELISSDELLEMGAENSRASGNVIQQVAYEQITQQEHLQSDLTLASLARRQDIDYLLSGELLPDLRAPSIKEQDPQLTISWRLMSLNQDDDSATAGQESQPNHGVRGRPVRVDLESAIQRYPDLAYASDTETALRTALVRDTYRLITPSVQRHRVQLEIPYLMPGSKSTRRGNALALAGRWPEAKAIWQEVADSQPLAVAALHNLALAAAAEQDFSTAKRLARQAIRRQPTRLHQQTLVWIEQRQRDYHAAFDLPDPPEGWFVTSDG
ncbi:tetratricopeptide repeat protein [Stieleria varia]|uniref:Tetratricopeptide repeat protein n=1 Tax=Stieleria varia TaxID=2528005 RepID=A0A5C6B7S6_9BACT|nr:hypothetical protein [Stieleria varia]TWU07471.1 Tetratricopeptide repeat protein [Stieleria varia]